MTSRDRTDSGPGALPKAHRVWRLRKLHQSVDAELADRGAEGVELRFRYNGALAYHRVWPTRAEAVAAASDKRRELEREGWTAHW